MYPIFYKNPFVHFLLYSVLFVGCSDSKQNPKTDSSEKVANVEHQVFPHKMPKEKPNFPLSASAERMFDYPAPRVQDNELYSLFKYTELKGFDYNGGDGTVSRRDPSRPIFVDGTYYVYYTKRHTKVPPIGWNRAKEATDEIPSTDWDLAEIWYATSTDGINWKEEALPLKDRKNQKPDGVP